MKFIIKFFIEKIVLLYAGCVLGDDMYSSGIRNAQQLKQHFSELNISTDDLTNINANLSLKFSNWLDSALSGQQFGYPIFIYGPQKNAEEFIAMSYINQTKLGQKTGIINLNKEAIRESVRGKRDPSNVVVLDIWFSIIYECINLSRHNLYLNLQQQAIDGVLDLNDYIDKCVETEIITGLETAKLFREIGGEELDEFAGLQTMFNRWSVFIGESKETVLKHYFHGSSDLIQAQRRLFEDQYNTLTMKNNRDRRVRKVGEKLQKN